MTTASAMVSLESFRSAIRPVLASSPENLPIFRASLAGSHPTEMPGIAPLEMPRAISAYRLLWDIASKEGITEVIDELMDAFPGLSRSFLEGLLQTDPRMTERVRGIRTRDGFLPLLTESHLSLDVRIIEPTGTTDAAWMVPVVTARLEFDEDVGASSVVVFQLPLPDIDELIDALSLMKQRISRIESTIESATVPDWAIEGPVQ
jgi:hypothetical protein